MSISDTRGISIRVKAAILNKSRHGQHSPIAVFKTHGIGVAEVVFANIIYTQKRIAEGDASLVGVFSEGSHTLKKAYSMINNAANYAL